jgi:hypothetical protein
MGCTSKIVVFDMDETLGYFTELGMFWDALTGYIKYTKKKIPINQELFNRVLDLYPEFLRPNIIGILNYLKKKKQKNSCDKLMIYTNNQGPEEWGKYIMNYFNNKLEFNMFDQIIAAFKVQGRRVELCRTTHMKTHSDLIKCTKIPQHTQICFLDDVFYPDMKNENIYYINVKPYVHDLEFETMITRCLNSGILGGDNAEPTLCRSFILSFLKRYHYTYVGKTQIAKNVDNALSKKIAEHLHIFFKQSPKVYKTLTKTKRRTSIQNKTIKKRKH